MYAVVVCRCRFAHCCHLHGRHLAASSRVIAVLLCHRALSLTFCIAFIFLLCRTLSSSLCPVVHCCLVCVVLLLVSRVIWLLASSSCHRVCRSACCEVCSI